jgi:hypothetical protein
MRTSIDLLAYTLLTLYNTHLACIGLYHSRVLLAYTLLTLYHLQVGTHGNNLRLHDRQAVCVARGILSDPDILLLHRPAELFTSSQQETVLGAVRDWMDSSKKRSSNAYAQYITHSKTVIVSTDCSTHISSMCDVVLSVGGASAAKLFEPALYAKIHHRSTSSNDSASEGGPARHKKEV